MGFVLNRGVQTGPIAINAVGNVTITDGVATGFSATSVLQTAQVLDFTQPNYEICCRFKRTTTTSRANIIFRTKNVGGLSVQDSSAENRIECWIRFADQSSSTQYYFGTTKANVLSDFIFRRINGTSYEAILREVETGNIITSMTWNDTRNINYNTSEGLCFGGGSDDLTTQFMEGNIYIEGTYITVNGQLWAGTLPQEVTPSNLIIDDGANQTEANYLIVDNKLVWSNPKIYLQNNSNWNAYINTGIVPTNDMRFDVTAQITDTANTWDGAIFGERNANNAAQTSFLLWHNTNSSGWGSFCYGQGWSGNWNNLTPSIKGTKNRFKYDGSFLTVNGQIPTTGNWVSKSSFSTTYPIFLYGFNNTGSLENRRFHGRIYNATFWSGSTKLAEFVPVPAGMTIGSYTTPSAGMWDIVNQQFYANSGSGTFTWGKDQ